MLKGFALPSILVGRLSMKLELMNQGLVKEIFDFEQKNRTFFEKTLPARPATYQHLESFEAAMDIILYEQSQEDCYMYIIRDESNHMIGRINLVRLEDQLGKKYELGYRLAEAAQGKGYATEAVKMILDLALQDYGISIVEAGTATQNIASQKVLIKNGFKKIAEVKEVMQVNGKWLDGILYECVLSEA